MAAVVLGSFAVWQFILVSPIILINHVWLLAGEYVYGILLGICWTSAFLMLLAGLSFQSADSIFPLIQATK